MTMNIKLGGASMLQARVMMSTVHIITWVATIFFITLPEGRTDSKFLNRLNLGGSMSKIGDIYCFQLFFLSFSFRNGKYDGSGKTNRSSYL